MIRAATPADVPALDTLVRGLAEYERALDAMLSTPGQLCEALFGDHPAVFATLAEDDATGEPVGFALWFLSYSTWTGTHGIYLQDLFVTPSGRGKGHGRALMAELAGICLRRGYERLEWSVLDWNTPALGFYRALGSEAMDEWKPHRLSGAPLRALATTAGTVNDAIPLSN